MTTEPADTAGTGDDASRDGDLPVHRHRGLDQPRGADRDRPLCARRASGIGRSCGRRSPPTAASSRAPRATRSSSSSRAPARRWRPPSRRSAPSSRSRGRMTRGSRCGWASTRARRGRPAAASSVSTSTGPRGSPPRAMAARSSPRTRPGRWSRARCPPASACASSGSTACGTSSRPNGSSRSRATGCRPRSRSCGRPDTRPNNLPTQLTTFVGRDDELAEARRLFETTRLLTMTGPGGTGKTRLSLQLATTVAERLPRRRLLRAAGADPRPDAGRAADRVGGRRRRGQRPADRRTSLEDWLATRRVLLVLDNFEQVVDAGPIIAGLLRAAPELKVIATSRAALHVSGEQEYPVPGLPTPPDPASLSGRERMQLPGGARGLDAAAVSQYAAVRLFIERAVAVRPAFTVTNDNAPAVAAIAARLHGMPLAIELAAARVKLLSPDAILARLEHQLDVLSAGGRDLPARQQTLRGAIAWSYDLLDDGSRQPARPAVGLRGSRRHRSRRGGRGTGRRAGHRCRRRPDGARRPEPRPRRRDRGRRAAVRAPRVDPRVRRRAARGARRSGGHPGAPP